MSLWIDTNNVIHDDMEGEALSLPNWPKGMTAYTPPAPTAAQQLEAAKTASNATIYAQIIALESTQGRIIREAVIGKPGAMGQLQALDASIAVLRATLQP